ncbi:MAG: hypothetical protein ABIJ56_12670 [Pseudomonadota bacterium]
MRRSGKNTAAACASALAALVCIAGCQQDPITVTTYHFERGGAIDFVCMCESATGREEAVSMDLCQDEEDENDCYPLAFVLQVNRDEIGLVNIKTNIIIDSDVRVPFNTFAHSGQSPSDIKVSGDGKKLLVSHFGENYVLVFNTEEFLANYLPEALEIPLPGPSSSIVFSRSSAKAYVMLPDNGAMAVLDLEDLSADPAILSFPGPDTPDGEEDDMEEVAEMPDTPEPQPDVSEDVVDDDAGGDDPVTEDVPEEEAAPDVIEDPAGDDGEFEDGVSFAPWSVTLAQIDQQDFLIVAGTGNSGVLIFDESRLEEGLDSALVTMLLQDVAVRKVAVTPSGDFLYAVDRDEGTVHVLDMQTGEQVDTTRGNPLVRKGAIEFDGWATDVMILDIDFDNDDVGPVHFNGVFAFVIASNGRMYVIDIEDRNCIENSGCGDEACLESLCPAHVLRNSTEDNNSSPLWAGAPTLMLDEDQVQYIGAPGGYPVCDLFTHTFPPRDNPMYGVSFFPYDPWETVETVPDIRRALTQEWRLIYEGHLPYSHGIGGNIEPGGVLSDSGLPFCVVGVREGDILVIEGPPTPLSEETDCSEFPEGEESEIAYRITEAYQYRMVFEPMENPDGKEYPVPTEECYPFAVKFYVRAAGAWVVTGLKTGYLNEWTTDETGRCRDRMKACTTWTGEDCTLKNGRAFEEEPFINPYFKFIMKPGNNETGRDTQYVYGAVSGFNPLSGSVARLPVHISFLPWNKRLYISDAATEGLVEFVLEDFYVAGKYY